MIVFIGTFLPYVRNILVCCHVLTISHTLTSVLTINTTTYLVILMKYDPVN